MNIADIIALAKQGYKPSDIKELIAMAEPENPIDPPAPDPTPESPEGPAQENPEDAPNASATVPKESAQPEQANSTEQMKALEKKIEELQEQNRRQDVSTETPDPQLQVNDMVAGFM